MTSPTRQPQRTPLSAGSIRAAVLSRSRLYTAVDVVSRTGSTNADLLAAARAGAPAGTVLVAETQTAGRGRLDRSWQSQPGAALTYSVLLRPARVPPARRGWLPLLTGVAVASALRSSAGVGASLKWPNDVLAAAWRAGGCGQARRHPGRAGRRRDRRRHRPQRQRRPGRAAVKPGHVAMARGCRRHSAGGHPRRHAARTRAVVPALG